jgi:transportin-1
MEYDDEEADELLRNDSSLVPDSASSMKPRHHKEKTHTLEHENPEHKVGSEEDDYDEDEEDDEAVQLWNLRRTAASCLDMIAHAYGDEILESIFPIINNLLFMSEWKKRETAVLALGAIAPGSFMGMKPHLPVLVPLLTKFLSDSHPLICSISCWTLSRYSEFVFPREKTQANLNLSHEYFMPILEGVFR